MESLKKFLREVGKWFGYAAIEVLFAEGLLELLREVFTTESAYAFAIIWIMALRKYFKHFWPENPVVKQI